MSDSTVKILRSYRYDALDRLMDVGLLASDSTQRFYQENHLVTEQGQQTQRTILRHKNQPLAQQQRGAGVAATTLMATDQAHSLLKTVSGNNPQQFAYTAYGHHPTANGLSHLFGFNGEYPDEITGHYPLGQGNRFFNPVLMRFNSPDELSPFSEGGINSYAYCENDPINFHDPTGNIKSNITYQTTRSHALVIVKHRSRSVITTHRSNSVIIKHSSAIEVPSQAPSTISSPISVASDPMPNAQAPGNLLQPTPSRSAFPARSQTLESPATPHHHKASNPSNPFAIHRRKKLREYERRFGSNTNFFDHANPTEIEYITNLTTQMNKPGTPQSKRKALRSKRQNAINKVTSRALHSLNTTSTAVRD